MKSKKHLQEINKCNECEAYNGHHHPKCSKIDLETAKELLKQYYELWLTKEMWVRKRANMWKEESIKWKGKFFEVKHENNQLRKKIVKDYS